MEALVVIAILFVLSGPVLGIIALVAVRRLEGASNSGYAPQQIRDLTARVYELEKRLSTLNATGAATKTGKADGVRTAQPEPTGEPTLEELVQVRLPLEPAESPPPPPPTFRAPSLPRLEPALREQSDDDIDLESRIAGRWFSRIGIVALLFSVSYFLKWAFDNNWIGPSGRVAIGIVLGALMLPWSQWLLVRGYSYFSEGIVALGEATLFLSVWAGCQYYTPPLYSRDVGFIAMIVITAAMGIVAIGRNSQRIAVLSLVGGLLTPILVSSGKNEQIVLFTYLLVLAAGGLAVQWKKSWESLAPILFIGTQVYFWGWYSEFFQTNSALERTVCFATLFFLAFVVLPVGSSLQGTGLEGTHVLVLLFNELAYSVALFVLLWPNDKWPLTLLFIALAAAHVAIARGIPAPGNGQSTLPRLLFAGLALTFLTLAIPIRLEGNSITLSFAVEGAILAWTGFRTTSNYLRQAGYLLLGIAALRLLILPPAGGTFLFNSRFAAYLVLVACFGATLWSARSHSSSVGESEAVEVGIFAVAINVYALIALSLEFWDYFGKTNAGIDSGLAQHLSLSVLWTIYASTLLFVGVKSSSALLRWQSLALFGTVMGKVFFYDLSFLDRGYRILSFFVLGAVLMAVSFYYTRKLANQKGAA